jgi:hypothetical protein
MSAPIRHIDYRVCQVQGARVTFVNGEWQGVRPMNAANADESLRSCSFEWDDLRAVGDDGWELVSVAQGSGNDANARILYLRRDRG